MWASRNWRRILFSTGWAVLALSGGPEESRSRLPRILPDLNITHRGTWGQDALRNLCRLHWLAYLNIPLVGTLSQHCLCLIKSGNIFTLSTPIPFPLQHLSFSFNTQFSSSCPRNSPKCQTYRPKSFLILSKKQTKIPNSPVKIPQKPSGNFPHRHFPLTNPQHSLPKLPMPSSAQA